MSTENLTDILVGFTHPDAPNRLPLADLVEERLTNIALSDTIGFEDLVQALYKLGTNQTGS